MIRLAVALLVTLATAPSQAQPSGEYEVVALRRSGTVESTAETDKALVELLGRRAEFGEQLRWYDGTVCDSWATEPDNDIPIDLDDPILSDTIIESSEPPVTPEYINAPRLRLVCRSGEERAIAPLVIIDRHVVVTGSPSGSTYIILQKAYSTDLIRKLQEQLRKLDYHAGELTGEVDAQTRAAIGRFAEQCGARYAFADVVITENLFDCADYFAEMENR